LVLDLRLIREHPDIVKAGLKRRGSDAPIDEVIALDSRRRKILTEVEGLRSERNKVSKQIPRISDKTERESLISRMRQVGNQIESLESELREVESKLHTLLLQIPNIPDPEVPDGKDESDNVVVRQHGEPRELPFDARPHWEIGERLGIIDFAQGQKISGSRFYVLHGDGARLQRALITWMLDLRRQEGYKEVYPPAIVKEETLWASAHLPDFEDTMYHDVEDDVWFIPTAEAPLTGIHMNEIIPVESLPIRYAAYTPCFRREKMSAGKDVRGIKRGHQFDKVEMYHYTLPEDSPKHLEELVKHAEDTAIKLGLTCRVVELCTGDLGFKSRRTFDIEVWSPGVREWLEVSSCSNVGDFQARRAGIRFKRTPKSETEYVHTLNGSGLALPRVMIAILENYQQPDGSVVIPEVLRPYMGGQEVIKS